MEEGEEERSNGKEEIERQRKENRREDGTGWERVGRGERGREREKREGEGRGGEKGGRERQWKAKGGRVKDKTKGACTHTKDNLATKAMHEQNLTNNSNSWPCPILPSGCALQYNSYPLPATTQ